MPLMVAPSFHLPLDWAERLSVAQLTGSEWRSPTDEERGLLVSEANPSACLCLFCLPQHLQAAWWQMMEQAQSTGPSGFDGFVAAVAEFLDYKNLAVPEGTAFEVVVSQSGQWQAPRLWGGINLGEDSAFVVLDDMGGPTVRLRIDPGEGFRFPPSGLRIDRWAPEGAGPDVWLLMK